MDSHVYDAFYPHYDYLNANYYKRMNGNSSCQKHLANTYQNNFHKDTLWISQENI